MTGEKITLERFYGDLICQYMQDQQEHPSPDQYDIQAALELTDNEFKLGMDWCVRMGFIIQADEQERFH
ncbi:MAG: hypothetical protein H6672_20675 [Anaerolineaceae bacterium]|nr:hypothetical protein [Anaerolineaceae bacterium]